MITHSGKEIPDPPSDPVLRRDWKIIYYADLCGMSKEQLEKILGEKIDPSPVPPLPKNHQPTRRNRNGNR